MGGVATSTFNDAVNAEMAKIVDDIIALPTFDGVHDAPPLGLGDGGNQAAFQLGGFRTAMQNNLKEYRAAGNLCWARQAVDYDWPVNAKEIDHLTDFFFKKPAHLPGDGLIVAVGKDDDIGGAPGSLTVVSPIEVVHALWKAIWRDAFVDKKPESVLKEWRVILLTTSIKFVLIEDEESRSRKMHQLREDIAQQYKSLALSILNKMFNVLATAAKTKGNGDADPGDVAAMYATIQYAQNSEPVTLPFVKTAMLVAKKLLTIPSVKDALIKFDADNPPKHALDSSNKLDAIIQKTKPERHLEWTVLLLIDLLQSGGYQHQSVSLNALEATTTTTTPTPTTTRKTRPQRSPETSGRPRVVPGGLRKPPEGS